MRIFVVASLLAAHLLLCQAGSTDLFDDFGRYVTGAKKNDLAPHADCKPMDPDKLPRHFVCLPPKTQFHSASPEALKELHDKLSKQYPQSAETGRVKVTSVYLANDFQVTGQSVFKEGVNFDALFWTLEYGPGCEVEDPKKWCLSLLVKDHATDAEMKRVLTQDPTGKDGVDTLKRDDVPKDAPVLAGTPEGQKLIDNTIGLHGEGTRKMTPEENAEVLEALTSDAETSEKDEVVEEEAPAK